MEYGASSSEIEQMILGYKKAVIKYEFWEKIYTLKGSPENILYIFRTIRCNPKFKIKWIGKKITLIDLIVKIWTKIKRIKYLPMFYRSFRNRMRSKKAAE